MKKKSIIYFIIILCIIIFISIIVLKNKKVDKENIETVPIDYEEENLIDIEDNEEADNQSGEQSHEIQAKEEKIKEIKEEYGLQANENIYEIDTEYDGREVVVVKANIQYKVALAGIIKKKKPEFEEINSILENAPKHTGIWIEENSREAFLTNLKNITEANYKLDNQGYLIQESGWRMNKYDKAINEMLLDKKLHIFCVNSQTYLVDEVTGEIEEYPFEQTDPYTGYEYFVDDNKEMFIISQGLKGKINKEEVLREILQNN